MRYNHAFAFLSGLIMGALLRWFWKLMLLAVVAFCIWASNFNIMSFIIGGGFLYLAFAKVR